LDDAGAGRPLVRTVRMMDPENPRGILGRKIYNLTLIAASLYILYLLDAIVTSAIN
jgi:hypothetical protein